MHTGLYQQNRLLRRTLAFGRKGQCAGNATTAPRVDCEENSAGNSQKKGCRRTLAIYEEHVVLAVDGKRYKVSPSNHNDLPNIPAVKHRVDLVDRRQLRDRHAALGWEPQRALTFPVRSIDLFRDDGRLGWVSVLPKGQLSADARVRVV
jgi:hypothetical protein